MTTQIAIAIDWSELDLFGHVNNVMFFKYMQAARLRFCEQLGLTSLNEPGKLSFMVASSTCQFKKALYYPGAIKVSTAAKWVKNTSFCLGHTITDDAGATAAEGEDVLVLYDYAAAAKQTVPETLRGLMNV